MVFLFVQENLMEVQNINTDDEKRILLNESDIYETFTNDRGELYRSLQKEYGRCISKVYVGETDIKEIGWVFVKREMYNDCNETYLQETWITVHTKKPTKTIKYHYA